jgi:nucleoside-triphosphatase
VKRLLFITGRPGIGKTTVLLNVANRLKEQGCKVGGMVSKEAKLEGTRVGFEIIDFATNQKGWLAHVNQPSGPQVSKYKVNVSDLDQIGVKAIRNALKDADVVIVDEIGPMELFSQAFKQCIEDVIKNSKLVIGVIHHRASDPIIETVKKRKDAEIFDVTVENRPSLHNVIIQSAIKFLNEQK